jgi:DNA polymerase-3 subunit beta
MHFTVHKAQFLNALQKIIGVIPSKTSIPILSSLLLELEDNKLTLTGTDLEISISTALTVKAENNGSISVPAKLLADIVRELPDVPIEIISDDQSNVTLKTDRGVYRLSGEPKNEFPNIIIAETEGSYQINSNKLRRMITKTIFAVTTDELRIALMGILFQISENELRLVATDGHRLSKIVDNKFSSEMFGKNLIVPTKALYLLLKNIDSITLKDGIEITVSVGDNHVTFKWDGTSVYTKLIEGKYPKYESVIPFDNEFRLIVEREALVASVRRVSIFSNTITHQVRFIIGEKQMEIRSEDVEFGGEANEILPVDYSGVNMEIAYNANYMLDILKNVDTKDVVFLMKNSKSAALIYPSEQKEGEELQMLLMPIRLTED